VEQLRNTYSGNKFDFTIGDDAEIGTGEKMAETLSKRLRAGGVAVNFVIGESEACAQLREGDSEACLEKYRELFQELDSFVKIHRDSRNRQNIEDREMERARYAVIHDEGKPYLPAKQLKEVIDSVVSAGRHSNCRREELRDSNEAGAGRAYDAMRRAYGSCTEMLTEDDTRSADQNFIANALTEINRRALDYLREKHVNDVLSNFNDHLVFSGKHPKDFPRSNLLGKFKECSVDRCEMFNKLTGLRATEANFSDVEAKKFLKELDAFCNQVGTLLIARMDEKPTYSTNTYWERFQQAVAMEFKKYAIEKEEDPNISIGAVEASQARARTLRRRTDNGRDIVAGMAGGLFRDINRKPAHGEIAHGAAAMEGELDVKALRKEDDVGKIAGAIGLALGLELKLRPSLHDSGDEDKKRVKAALIALGEEINVFASAKRSAKAIGALELTLTTAEGLSALQEVERDRYAAGDEWPRHREIASQCAKFLGRAKGGACAKAIRNALGKLSLPSYEAVDNTRVERFVTMWFTEIWKAYAQYVRAEDYRKPFAIPSINTGELDPTLAKEFQDENREVHGALSYSEEAMGKVFRDLNGSNYKELQKAKRGFMEEAVKFFNGIKISPTQPDGAGKIVERPEKKVSVGEAIAAGPIARVARLKQHMEENYRNRNAHRVEIDAAPDGPIPLG
jgi:hypothetical protein